MRPKIYLEAYLNIPKQHSFADKFYDIRNIDYIKPVNIKNFEDALQKLPESERYYFSVNLTHRQTIIHLLDTASKLLDDHVSAIKFKKITTAYINSRNNLTPEAKEKMIKSLEIVKPFACICSHCPTIPGTLQHYILQNEPWVKGIFTTGDKEVENIRFLIIGLGLGEVAPIIEISPDYDPANPDSPLISQVFLTMSAFNSLQLVLHGKHTTSTMYVAGRFNPLLIRQADESLNGIKQRRPIELPHPDLVPDNHPHGAHVDYYSMLVHDLFHVSRNGINEWKDFSRALRNFLEAEKGFVMSKSIWIISDMDYNGCKKIKKVNNSFARISALEGLLTNVMERAFDPKDDSTITMNCLLLMAGFIIHSQAWEKLTGVDFIDWVATRNEYYRNSFNKMKYIIYSDKSNNQFNRSATYYVMRYILDEHGSKELCDKLIKTDVLSWSRNGGLHVKGCYTVEGKDINYANSDANITASNVDVLNKALQIFEKLNSIEITLVDKQKQINFTNLVDQLVDSNSATAITQKNNDTFILSRIWLRRTFRTQPHKYFELDKTLGDEGALEWRLPVKR